MEENNTTNNDTSKVSSKLANFGNKSHTFTRQENSKGGKTMTPLRETTLKLRGIVYCGIKCPIYSKCRYEPLSVAKYENKCALKMLEPRTRNKYINLLLGGEDEMFTEATNAMLGIDDSFKTVVAIEKIHKMRFGDRIKTEVVASSGDFFEQLKNKVKELKEGDKK